MMVATNLSSLFVVSHVTECLLSALQDILIRKVA